MFDRLARVRFVVLSTATVAACALAVGCSSDTGDAKGGSTTVNTGTYSIKVYVQHDGTQTRLDVLPFAPVASRTRHDGTLLPTDVHTTTIQPTTLGGGNGTTIIGGQHWLTPTNDAQNLITAAAAQCGMVGLDQALSDQLNAEPLLDDSRYDELRQQIENKQTVTALRSVLPWTNSPSGPAWYIFPNHPQTCDQVLEYEETLLCVADKLAQLADAVSPIEWDNVRFLDRSQGTPDISWVVPPQADQDKFIARDTAIEVLSHIAWLDSLPFEGVDSNLHTCSALYAAYDKGTVPQVEQPALTTALFGSGGASAYPPNPTDPNARARSRMTFETNTLRAAGQLVHDLVREAVYSDLAGSAHLSASAADTKGGQSAAWGWSGTNPYQSLGHAARVLLGRWEMGPACTGPGACAGGGEVDPLCGGIAELDLLKLADQGTRARANSTTPSNSRQALAASMMESAGIVVKDGTPASSIRPALDAQLFTARGIDRTSQTGVALKAVLDSLSDADIAQGAQRTQSTFALLTSNTTNDNAQFSSAAVRVGLPVSTVSNPSLSGVGVAIDGGLSRARTVTDVMARAGLPMSASQCGEYRGGLPTIMMSETAVAPLVATDSTFDESYNARFMRQDAFTIGQALRSRLVKLREVADQSGLAGSGSAPDARARAAAVAELGAWSGTGRAIVSTDIGDAYRTGSSMDSGGGGSMPQHLYLDLVGVDPKSFAVDSPAAIGGAVSLVLGDPSLAECAAKVSTTICDATALAAATWKPSGPATVWVDSSNPATEQSWRQQYGVTNTVVRLTFDLDNSAPAQLRGNLGWLTGALNPLHIVQSQDPAKPLGTGAVLGALHLPVQVSQTFGLVIYYFAERATALSPMRNELLEAALGLGRWVGAAPPRAGENALASSPQYCVEGVPRDVFVPLENDLTSDSDAYENSWRHYVSLARDAATRADTIGQTWVDIGFQRDVTRENAGEQVQQIESDPINIDDITVDEHGNIKAGDSNGALDAVLNQPVVDLVFFTTDPFAKQNTQADKLAALRGYLNCGSMGPQHPLCASTYTSVDYIDAGRLATFKKKTLSSVITYSALGLSDAQAPPPAKGTSVCKPIVDSAAAMKGLGGPFSNEVFGGAIGSATGQWTADPQRLGDEMSRVRMTVDVTGNWQVTHAGAVMMDSASGASWPGCLATTCNFSDPLIDSLNKMFRWCDDPGQIDTPLGACESDGGNDMADQELNALRWRVQGVLWLAATMTGGIPGQMFDVPMPAANFTTEDDQHVANVNTVYGNGFFAIDSNGDATLASPFNDLPLLENNEFNALLEEGTKPHVIAPRFQHWGPNVDKVLPLWLRRIYAPGSVSTSDMNHYAGTSYLHVFGKNPSGASNFQHSIPDFFQQQLQLAGLAGDRLDGSAFAAVGRQLDGRTCATPFGSPVGGPFGGPNMSPNWMLGLVAALKTEQLAESAMRSQNAGSMWSTIYVWNGSSFFNAPPPTVTFSQNTNWFNNSPVRYVPVAFTDSWYPAPMRPGDSWDGMALFGVRSGGGINIGNGVSPIEERLPSYMPPSARVRHSVNSGAPNGNCGAAWEFTQAVALTCLASSDLVNSLPPPSTPPTNITSEADLVQLEQWLRLQLDNAGTQFSHGFVEQIPTAIVQSAIGLQSNSGSAKGDYGAKVQEISVAMLDISTQWALVLNDGYQMTADLAAARDAIDVIKDEAQVADKTTLIQRLGTYRDMAQEVAKMASGIADLVNLKGATSLGASNVAGGVNAAAAGVSLILDGQIVDALADLDRLNAKEEADKIRGALIQLSKSMSQSGTDLHNALITIRKDLATVRGGQLQLNSERSQAAYFAGKAAGLGVWNCGTSTQPVECTSHVNTVLNRRYAGFEIRYKRALRDAKALAYLARLAIEQRIGVHLNDITTRVGPLDPPSVWADDVCRLTGVNYARLRQESDLDAGTTSSRQKVDGQIASEFADAFIGDYVEKLANFVEFYNVAFPQKDANDTAVLSLRENVLLGNSACSIPSPNELVESSRLYAIAPSSGSQSEKGWQRNTCATTSTTCVQALSLGAVELPLESPQGGVSWIVDKARPPLQNGVDIVNSGAIDGPDGFVSQAVYLDPGTFALSWWDQARDVAGAPAASAPTYRVGVYDSSWNPVAVWTGRPADGTQPAPSWSDRRVLSVSIASPGTYHVAFAASLTGQGPGSVAIANTQFETLGQGQPPSAYADTDSSGRIPASLCAATAGQLRQQFKRACDPDGTCYYDLLTPITIDTAAFAANGVSLKGKLASGNFNFRHVDVALNLVGTAVRDCTGSGSPDCYASAYIEYTLAHDGNNVGVLGLDGQSRAFDFGVGSISHGKALTAERYITTPIGSSDQQLLSAFLKPEFRGRPIDGVYHLRIYDTPSLHWDRLDDIQLVLNYHYWSRVATGQ